MQYFIEVKILFCLITLYLQWQSPTCICFCCCVVCVVVGSVLSRVPRAWLLTSEVIIYSIYKTMYVQNRKIWKTKDTEAKVKQKPDGTASLPLSKKTIINKCAVYIIWNSMMHEVKGGQCMKSMMHMNIWFLHYCICLYCPQHSWLWYPEWEFRTCVGISFLLWTFSDAFANFRSFSAALSCGIPPGSILGPNLFPLYMLSLGQILV